MSAPQQGLGRRTQVRRAALFLLTMVACAGFLGYRLVTLQVLEPDRALDWGSEQRFSSWELSADRGAIVDRNGVDLALSAPARSLYADPRYIEDPAAVASQLAPMLGRDVDDLAARLGSDRHFIFLARQVDDVLANAVLDLGFAGVLEMEEPTRIRPSGNSLAISTIGKTDIDGRGVSGIEMMYDELLTGTPGTVTTELGTGGRSVPGGIREVVPAVEGQTLVLTLDRTLQFEAERQLVSRVNELDAAGGLVLIMDPKTGEVLANATVTAEMNEETGNRSPAHVVGENRAVTWAFEPGSVSKAFTFAGVLEEGLGTLEARQDVPYSITYFEGNDDEEKTFVDSKWHEVEFMSIEEIIAESSNVGTILWADTLGNDRLHSYLSDFGFGSVTDLSFPGETTGRLPDVDEWFGVAPQTISFGQGVSVTPMQLLAGYSTIANGGVRVDPTFVRGSRTGTGEFIPAPEPIQERVISETTADSLVQALTSVVETGTGTPAAVPGYNVAGKTGTARKPRPDGGYYGDDGVDERRYISSFVGFAPSYDPRLAILVVIDEPDNEYYSGSLSAAPLFADLARYSIRHLEIPSESDLAHLVGNERVRTRTVAELAAEAEATSDAVESEEADELALPAEDG